MECRQRICGYCHICVCYIFIWHEFTALQWNGIDVNSANIIGLLFFCRSFWKVWRLYTPVELSNRQSCNAFYCNVVVKVLATGFTFSVGANDITDGSPIDLAPVFSDWDIWKSLYNFSNLCSFVSSYFLSMKN